jgi:hypothetical protein
VKFNEQVSSPPADGCDIENIIISFYDIYEKEKQKFKEIRSERSTSREKSLRSINESGLGRHSIISTNQGVNN